MPLAWSASTSAIVSAHVWRRRCQESGVTPAWRPIATMTSSALSEESGSPDRATNRYGLLPGTLPSGGGYVRYARTAASKKWEAGIARSAVFTPAHVAGSRSDRRVAGGSARRHWLREVTNRAAVLEAHHGEYQAQAPLRTSASCAIEHEERRPPETPSHSKMNPAVR